MPVPSDSNNTVEYRCGGCGKVVVFNPHEPIRCKECSYRIVYKSRTQRCIQYEIHVCSIYVENEEIIGYGVGAIGGVEPTHISLFCSSMNSVGQQEPGVEYRCGECGKIVKLSASDPIFCVYCGYRVVFKLPIKNENQYEAI